MSISEQPNDGCTALHAFLGKSRLRHKLSRGSHILFTWLASPLHASSASTLEACVHLVLSARHQRTHLVLQSRQQSANAFASGQPSRANAFGGSAGFGQPRSTGSILDRVQPAQPSSRHAFGETSMGPAVGTHQWQHTATTPRNAFGGGGAGLSAGAGHVASSHLPPPPPRAPSQGFGIASRLSAAPQSHAFGGAQRQQGAQHSNAFGTQPQQSGVTRGNAFGVPNGYQAAPAPHTTGHTYAAFGQAHRNEGSQRARPHAFAQAGAMEMPDTTTPAQSAQPFRNAFSGSTAGWAGQQQQPARALQHRLNAFGGAAPQVRHR